MSYIPIDLVCTAKKPDGSLVYGVPRMIWQGRIHVFRSGADRTAFFTLIRKQMSDITGKDLTKLGVTWTITSAAQMAQLLEDYPSQGTADDAILAELEAQSEDIEALRAGMDPPPTPPA